MREKRNKLSSLFGVIIIIYRGIYIFCIIISFILSH
jgi:hypothetical protein